MMIIGRAETPIQLPNRENSRGAIENSNKCIHPLVKFVQIAAHDLRINPAHGRMAIMLNKELLDSK